MRTRIERWTRIDRLLFAVCYGMLGLIVGFGAALFVAKYLNTGFSSVAIIVMVSLVCSITGFIAPNIISLCFKKIWLWMRFWWS